MKWLGSNRCDICDNKIEGTLYDAVTIHGPWATMCEPCWKLHSYNKLGTGLGQKYKENEKHEFIKED